MIDLSSRIEQAIVDGIQDAQVIVDDPMNDNTHFEVSVISQSFEGLSLVQQHRRVMGLLKELLAGDVHAVALKTYTPEKWASR